MKGKLIVIDAIDGSGKETQVKKLYDRLLKEGINIKKVDFPNYSSDSSALIKMYLNGDFGQNAGDVSPYIASMFYAVDRYATYKKDDFGKWYNEGNLILMDRYTTANMIHQASKIDNKKEKQKFLEWLYELEFEILGIPKPDEVIFLDMPPKYSLNLIKDRNNKFCNNSKKDIHENNFEYLQKSYDNSCRIADKYNWKKISCVKNGKVRTIEEIHEAIYSIVKNIIL